MGAPQEGIPSDRVVAVVASLDSGRLQIGSGYLVTRGLVLTARHCTVDKVTGQPARSLRVIRRSDGVQAAATVIATTLDVAVVAVDGGSALAAGPALEPPVFGRVDRSRSGELHDCQAVGFPLWQMDSRDQQRNAAELHGTIRATEDAESGLLVLRDPLLNDVGVPSTATAEDRAEGSPWGGLSGAVVFWQGIALGVIIEHHPRQGRSAITILPVERLATGAAGGQPGGGTVAAALGLPPVDMMPLAGGRPLAAGGPLAGLVEVVRQGRLPRVGQLNPYTLGATPSDYGSSETYGQHDGYVPRSKDGALAAALRPGRFVMLVGPSKAGKTRTAFEALRAHDDWSNAPLAAPAKGSLDQLASHPALGTSDPLVIWLDDLERFLAPFVELTQATISRLCDRPGPTVLLATIRPEQLERLLGPERELTREVRMVVDSATRIELASTREDPDEQARAATTYPQIGARPEGLAEMLAGAPKLLQHYRDAAAAERPVLHMLVQTCIDWARCGLERPIPEPDLLAVARDTLEEKRTDLDLDEDELGDALRQARHPIAGGGQVALLGTRRLPDRSRGYEAFDYLIAADDGQGDALARPVADATWRRFLAHGTDDDAFAMGTAAMRRGNSQLAIEATRRAAEAGIFFADFNLGALLANSGDPALEAEARTWLTRTAEAGNSVAQLNLDILDNPVAEGGGVRRFIVIIGWEGPWGLFGELAANRAQLTKAAAAGDADSQYQLGVLLAREDPPKLGETRIWWTRAAEAGHIGAQVDLGTLLVESLDPPELAEARTLWTRAAEAGNTVAQLNLGRLLAFELDPPQVAEARGWLTKAAEAGITDAQFRLAVLLANMLDPPQLAEARTWLTKAAEAGDSDAQFNLGRLAARQDPPELAEARIWYTKAAEAGHVEAQFNLGLLLDTLLYPPDLAEARIWYTKAAEAGSTDAQAALGLLLSAKLDPPELAEVRVWYTKAAEAGYTLAQFNLGVVLTDLLEPPEMAEARNWWTRAAEAGNTDAQNGLGELLINMLDPPEMAEARAWWTRAAKAGHTGAQANLGRLLAFELDPPELAEARIWFTKAAEAGDGDAQANLGLLLATRLNPPELDEARTWYTRAAEAGNTFAQLNLGVLLVDRLDPPELAEARTWWIRAAESGSTFAQVNLGLVLAFRLDPPELAEARTWLTKAADAGDTDAQFHLGRMLTDVLDPPDIAQARAWYTRAAEAGGSDAQTNLGMLLATMVDPPELAEARIWLTRAAEAGNSTAQAILGWLLTSRLDPPELAEARAWYTRAAEAGNTDAQVGLGFLLFNELDPPELAEARSWLTKAAETGDVTAQLNLGVLLVNRLDPPELTEGRAWYTRAAEAGDSDAQANLGMLLATMVDPPELAEARTWLTLAAEAGNTGARDALAQLGDN